MYERNGYWHEAKELLVDQVLCVKISFTDKKLFDDSTKKRKERKRRRNTYRFNKSLDSLPTSNNTCSMVEGNPTISAWKFHAQMKHHVQYICINWRVIVNCNVIEWNGMLFFLPFHSIIRLYLVWLAQLANADTFANRYEMASEWQFSISIDK